MLFTYNSYRNLMRSLVKRGYAISSYKDWNQHSKCVILRHDIDYDIEKALKFARIEAELNIKSTYFILVTSDFYNIFSLKNQIMMRSILDCGHDIGLHFDELRYPDIITTKELYTHIMEEIKLLSLAIGRHVDVVSMHRPSKMTLETDWDIPGIINSYSRVFFKGFKYLSDSRRRWREPVEEIINSEKYNRLHILTHAFWYNETEQSLQSSLLGFINSGNRDRYSILERNFTQLEEEISEKDIIGGH